MIKKLWQHIWNKTDKTERNEKMKLIAGLGNPGSQYDKTRHNIGFMALDFIADAFSISMDNDKKHKGLVGKGMIGSEKVMLVKPQTYMNLSGECIGSLSNYYGIDPEDIIIIYDDISLDVGQLRIRKKGSAGGHNGIKSIIAHLGTTEFPRIKMGVGERMTGQDLADHVLAKFPKDQMKLVEQSIVDTKEALYLMLTDNIDKAMNQYNGKQK